MKLFFSFWYYKLLILLLSPLSPTLPAYLQVHGGGVLQQSPDSSSSTNSEPHLGISKKRRKGSKKTLRALCDLGGSPEKSLLL